MSVTSPPPEAVLLDVNETLTDLHALAPRLEAVGAPAGLLDLWFASTLRDGFALTAAGAYATFPEVASAVLTGLLATGEGGGGSEAESGANSGAESGAESRAESRAGSRSGVDAAAEASPSERAATVLAGLGELPLHPDVRPGVRALREAGLRVAALTNGAAESAKTVLERGGVIDDIEVCLSVEEVRRWKPAPETYRYAAEFLGLPVERIVLVAVHPWDVDGAERAGLSSAWINRAGAPYPDSLLAPEYKARSLVELAVQLAGRVRTE